MFSAEACIQGAFRLVILPILSNVEWSLQHNRHKNMKTEIPQVRTRKIEVAQNVFDSFLNNVCCFPPLCSEETLCSNGLIHQALSRGGHESVSSSHQPIILWMKTSSVKILVDTASVLPKVGSQPVSSEAFGGHRLKPPKGFGGHRLRPHFGEDTELCPPKCLLISINVLRV